MTLNTARFGQIMIDDSKVITFADGLPGFEELKRFILLEPEQTKPLYWVQAVEDGDIALPVFDSFQILQDYALDIDDSDVESLMIESPEDLLVLNVAVIPGDVTKMTANMAAPILINYKKNMGKQIVVDGKHETRYPVFADIARYLKAREEDTDAGADPQDG